MDSQNLGKIIKQQRISIPLTLIELARMSGVSSSHLGRIERGERFPSARILQKIAKPLGFNETELFTLANYLSPRETALGKTALGEMALGEAERRLDPYVANLLAREPVEVQRAVVAILIVLKSIAKGIAQENR